MKSQSVISKWRKMVTYLLLLGPLTAVAALNNTELQFEKVSESSVPPVDVHPGNTHVAILTIFLTEQNRLVEHQLDQMVAKAQERLDRCHIQLVVDRIVQLKNNMLFAEWESVDYNGYVTDWERDFFSRLQPNSNAVLFVESLDWAIGDDGIVAVGYPSSYLDFTTNFEPNEQDRHFYIQQMTGKMVLGKAISEWTFLHEIGHAILDLQHTESQSNVMFPDFGEYKKIDPIFTEQQCEHGRNNYPHVIPLDQTTNLDLTNNETEYL